MAFSTALEPHDRIAAVRRFNRFITQRIGLLQEGLLDSPWSLTEARILYEIAQDDGLTAGELSKRLDLNPGYMSRLLKRFQQKGLLTRSPSSIDARRRNLSLTAAGREVFDTLDRRSQSEIAEMLWGLPPENQQKLVTAMHMIETLLAPAPTEHVPWLLRSHRTGDMGWVIWRHGVLYAREYGWNQEFEALVARIVADFISNPDPSSERCWIAERDGARVGSIFLVRESDEIAKLRLLLVEPAARGLGIGHRLVEECIHTARELGYRRLVLWTNDVLHAARHVYEDKGFRLVKEEPHHSFGHDLVGQYWELDLSEVS